MTSIPTSETAAINSDDRVGNLPEPKHEKVHHRLQITLCSPCPNGDFDPAILPMSRTLPGLSAQAILDVLVEKYHLPVLQAKTENKNSSNWRKFGWGQKKEEVDSPFWRDA